MIQPQHSYSEFPLANNVMPFPGTDLNDLFAPRILRPRYDHVDTTSRMEMRLKAMQPWFNHAVLATPQVLHDASAFFRLAIAHGYPKANGGPLHSVERAELLLAVWQDNWPEVAKEASCWVGAETSRMEPFKPGPLCRLRPYIARIRKAVSIDILRDRTILEQPFRFFQLCVARGYDGPGDLRDLGCEDDFKFNIGTCMIAAWTLETLE